MHVLAFDIETVPDTNLGRKLHGLEGLTDEEVAQVMYSLRRQETGGEFLALYQHRVVAIAVALRTGATFKVWSLGAEDAEEPEIIGRFFEGLERYCPDLVSWNGGGFDLPVLHYRALQHGIQAEKYWDTGNGDRDFKWNNYLNRFHWRHIDLMDVLSGYQLRARAPLDAIAVMLGFPGKLGMTGARVWQSFLDGDIAGIRNYCESDVVNTYLVYLRFELMRGNLDQDQYEVECARVKKVLADSAQPHFEEFLNAWERR